MNVLQWLREKCRWFVPVGTVSFLPFGTVLMGLAAGFAIHSWMLTRPLVHTSGTVTENVASKADDGETVYTTHIRFRLPTGDVVTTTDPVLSGGNGDRSFAAGAEVPILYPTSNPHAAYIATKGRVYFIAISLGVLGIAIFDLGLICRRFAMKLKSAVAS